MCGRFAFFSPREAVQEYFGIEVPFALEPRYNVAPSQEVAVIRRQHNRSAVGRLDNLTQTVLESPVHLITPREVVSDK